jgi:hypothetical protein
LESCQEILLICGSRLSAADSKGVAFHREFLDITPRADHRPMGSIPEHAFGVVLDVLSLRWFAKQSVERRLQLRLFGQP